MPDPIAETVDGTMRCTTDSNARARLAALWDHVEGDRDPIVLTRHGHADMAVVPAANLRRLQGAAPRGHRGARRR